MPIYFYLIRHGDVDPTGAPDPYNIPLSTAGQMQAQRLAERCQTWGLQMLCVSTNRRDMDTADPISERIPNLLRWDLEELEDLNLEDLHYAPGATHLVSTWTPEQLEQGYVSLWNRVTAAWTRILLYAQANHLERIGIVAGEAVLNALLAALRGEDWRALIQSRVDFKGTQVCCVTFDPDRPAEVAWFDENLAEPRQA